MSGKYTMYARVCVCVRETTALFNHNGTLTDPPHPDADLILSITLHTSVPGSIINTSQIPPYRTRRGILLISISHSDPPEALHNGALQKTAMSKSNA